MVNALFWKNKRVFLTGHTGFKGSWLSIWLTSLGAEVKGFALAPAGELNLYTIADMDQLLESDINDIRDYSALLSSMKSFSPDIVIHMAAQPLVRYSYLNPVETYEVNVMGTVNLLESVRYCRSVQAVVNVTTDKCYQNDGSIWGYRETDPMGGHDPYSNSKGCAELVTAAFRDSFLNDTGVGVASARAGNVIGGGDWADDRLIPDVIRSFQAGKPVVIRNPNATRPWQHVLEPLSGYLMLAEKLYFDGEGYRGGWNFGPKDEDVKPVSWILDKMTAMWADSTWYLERGGFHEAAALKLDISKAAAELDWQPTWDLSTTLHKIIMWNERFRSGDNMRDVCLTEIEEFAAVV